MFSSRYKRKEDKQKAVSENSSAEVKDRIFMDTVLQIITQTEAITDNSNELDGSINEIASIVQQLSANSEETASATQEINNNIKNVNSMVTDVAVCLVDNMGTVSEISARADIMKEDAVVSQTNAVNMCRHLEELLAEAVDKAEIIKEIDRMTDSILSIASQINLISLNASIEAARAGTYGRGFAVVASEIKKLADQTKLTVMDIHKIAGAMNDFLKDLVHNSSLINSFMKEQVIRDYNKLVSISEQYRADAEGINGIFDDYASTIDALTMTMESISQQVADIATATEEDAKGAGEIAGNLVTLNEKSEKISADINQTVCNLKKLSKEAEATCDIVTEDLTELA